MIGKSGIGRRSAVQPAGAVGCRGIGCDGGGVGWSEADGHGLFELDVEGVDEQAEYNCCFINTFVPSSTCIIGHAGS